MLQQPTVNDLRQLLLLHPTSTTHLIQPPPAIGKKSLDILLINTLLPYRYAYALAHHDTAAAQAALTLMQHIPAEENTIIRQWRLLGQQINSAADTQALIHLYQYYCQNERCIHCEVGQQVFLLQSV
jgi:7-keto-8-aminopelargonate synthetase-like enzyme